MNATMIPVDDQAAEHRHWDLRLFQARHRCASVASHEAAAAGVAVRVITKDMSIERASPNDMMQLATDVGPVPMQVGALLVLAPGADIALARGVLASRIAAVPRLRQRLVPTPIGCGRPIWIDHQQFDVNEHVHFAICEPPGDEHALMTCATAILGTRLPNDRPPWAATFVSGLQADRTALFVVFNHVLADGIGGLAVLANLVDGTPEPRVYGFPRPAPTLRAVALDAASSRWQTLRRWPRAIANVRSAFAELKPGTGPAPRTSLNRPTGSRRATSTARVPLDVIRAEAHAHDGTVNDAVLAAVTEALRELLAARGEALDRLVVSIPISARRTAGATDLGNDVGVLPVEVPVLGAFNDRLGEIARITRSRKQAGARGSSAAVAGPLFRAMAALHLLRWFMDRQHLINTLVTNLRGPEDRLAFAGATIEDVIPMSIVTGNVTVAFAVLSYAGQLTITINADADACPDLAVLTNVLQRRLDALTDRPITLPS